MSQPKIINNQIDIPTLYEWDGEPGWDDLIGPLANGHTTNTNDPAWVAFRNGIYAYSFSATAMREIWLTFHVNHGYAPGTKLYPHIHWSTAGTNTGVVRWGIEYTIAKCYSQEVFPTTSTLYLEQAADATPYTHQIIETTEPNAIVSTHIEPDSLILIRMFRDAAHANDTCTDAAFGLQCDIHFQRNSVSTPNRNYPFS